MRPAASRREKFCMFLRADLEHIGHRGDGGKGFGVLHLGHDPQVEPPLHLLQETHPSSLSPWKA